MLSARRTCIPLHLHPHPHSHPRHYHHPHLRQHNFFNSATHLHRRHHSTTAVPLHSHRVHNPKAQGERPLIVLHGLFGSYKNWRLVSRQLSTMEGEAPREMHLLDLRNHGDSPHTPAMDYDAMAEDVARYLTDNGLTNTSTDSGVDMLGFSMGGKVAMTLALSQPQHISRLIIGDMAPVSLHDKGEGWDIPQVIDAIRHVDLSSVQALKDADHMLQDGGIANPEVRGFLLTNLERRKNQDHQNKNTYRWRINVDAIYHHLDELADFPIARQSPKPFTKNSMFIRGGRSNLCQDAFLPDVRRWFPNTRIETFEQSGHWIHVEQPDRFRSLISEFLYQQ